ncbi:MAG: hypothetical protein EZS28_033542 [Streblomastix strix]|uniref:Uncharacterized protein n=1 Tax=Streblomastix strix TaxID=222440 RepID=A0A5J4UL51_9EUKA|nr:MAG: hypothetical protein EZS28_033542 [Streblomastix strix]
MKHQEVDIQKTDVEIEEKDPVSGDGHKHIATVTTHSGSEDQPNGLTEYNVNEGGLLYQIERVNDCQDIATCVQTERHTKLTH